MFAFSGFLASLAGVLTEGSTFTATMIMGDSAEMDAIAAVVLGGTSMSGGKGSISGNSHWRNCNRYFEKWNESVRY